MGGEASTEGDAYSYGVLVLEMFTGRMLTYDMFKDGLNLHNFVKMTLPKRLAQVVDLMLLPRGAVEMGATTSTMMAIEEDEKNGNEIEVDEACPVDPYLEWLGVAGKAHRYGHGFEYGLVRRRIPYYCVAGFFPCLSPTLGLLLSLGI
ncbi:uncharacterized protein LOC115985726 [Quercus lobata]|uniref:uncharacterized protein LOC115985726 n=1 Tax=Quercus lobata TaxID=97700 RepID=UPI001248D47E|nr:uncharacterized protein LOC115985726 [Quercus lobata]